VRKPKNKMVRRKIESVAASFGYIFTTPSQTFPSRPGKEICGNGDIERDQKTKRAGND